MYKMLGTGGAHLLIGHILLLQLPVHASLVHELLVTALLQHGSLLHVYDARRVDDGGETVGDHEGGAAHACCIKCCLDLVGSNFNN